MFLLSENIVDSHDTVRPGAPGVVDDGGVGLDEAVATVSQAFLLASTHFILRTKDRSISTSWL